MDPDKRPLKLEEDLPEDFFDEFASDEFMAGLDVVDSWDGKGKRSKPSESDLRELLRTRKEEAAREQRASPERRHRTRSPERHVERAIRRDVDKTNRDIKKDKEMKVKEYLAKRLDADGEEVPPGTELDDYFENPRKRSPSPPRQKERRFSISPQRVRNTARPRYMQASRPVFRRQRSRSRTPSPPRGHFVGRRLRRSRSRSRGRRSRSRSRPRRSGSRPRRSHSRSRRSNSRSRRSGSRPRRSRDRFDSFQYQVGSYPPQESFGPSGGFPPQPYNDGYYPPPMGEPQPLYFQAPNYQYGSPMGGPSIPPLMSCQPMGGQPMGGQPMGGPPMGPPMGGQPMGGQPMGGPPMGGPGLLGPAPMGGPAMAAPYGYDPMPPPMHPQPVPPPASVLGPQGVPAPVNQAAPQQTDPLEKLLAEGKISQEDYLKLTPKGRINPADIKDKEDLLKRCHDAVTALGKLHLPNRLIMSTKFTIPEQKAITTKFCSPLKRLPTVVFNFTSSKSSALQTQNKQLVDSIISTIGLQHVLTKPAKKKNNATKFKDASCQTSKPFCESCEIRELTKFNAKGTMIDHDHFSTSVHTQVIEVDLASSKTMFTPGGNISEGGSMSLSHLTPAQLIVSQLVARAKKLESTASNSPESEPFMRRPQPNNSQHPYYGQQNQGTNQYQNNWY